DAVDGLAGEPHRPRDDAVRAVRSDEDARRVALAAGFHLDAALADTGRRDLHALPPLRARGRRLLREEVVETAALRHQDDRLARPPLVARPVAEAERHPLHAVLDDGLDGERQLADG